MAEGKPFENCGKLFDITRAFDHTPQTEELFNKAMNEALRWHVSKSPEFKSFLNLSGLIDFKSDYLPEQIPPLLVTVFKEFK
ncbi:MAG: hypothetical protein PHQ02_08175, partial [Candidatus Riflebacteria bacterium]|nr:hypothetical protein [Candidatus Riflebacteria bacterium]